VVRPGPCVLHKRGLVICTEPNTRYNVPPLSSRANGVREGLKMEFQDGTHRDVARHCYPCREGFAAGRSLREISEETGLLVSEVLQREVDLHLIPADEAAATLSQGPH
jgi:hypothetical protein